MYRGNEDHPALEDFTRHLRTYAPDTASYDEFVRQWFDTVVVPEYRVDSAATSRLPSGEWETRAVVRNVGTGRMRLEIGAVRGERFPDDTSRSPSRKAPPPYAQAISVVTLAAREQSTVRIRSTFEPEKVVIDPDVRVLQLRRKLAERKVEHLK
jgi:ABC-2 type transport system permease protein